MNGLSLISKGAGVGALSAIDHHGSPAVGDPSEGIPAAIDR